MQTREQPVNRPDQNDQDKQQMTVFTDNDQMFEENNQEGMYENLQIKLGKTNLELHRIIASL